MDARINIATEFTMRNKVTVYHGSCVELFKAVPNESVQLVITSPPYNLGKDYEQRKQSLEEYLALQRSVIAESVRVLKPGGSLCWQVGHHTNGHGQIIPLDMLLYSVFAEFDKSDDLRLRNRIIWHFEHGLHCQRRLSGRHEAILWYTKGDEYEFNLDAVRVPQKYPGKRAYQGPNKGKFSGNPLGKNPGDVWIFPNVKGNHIEKTKHPCQFPIELAERLVVTLSKERDIVLDPFGGVGSTAIAAVLNKRRAVMADTCARYVRIAKKRITLAVQGDLKYRSRTLPVYVPKPNTPLTTPPANFRFRNGTSQKL